MASPRPADPVRLAPELTPESGTPLYVHVPFCLAKCTYCDFFSVPAEGQDLAGTLDALLVEAERRSPRRPRTVFLGGGTPSYYSAEELGRLLDGLDRWSGFRSSADEVTCECNPESLDLEKARALRELGVDRLSIGFQSLDPRILELFGRVHTADESFAAFDAARSAGFSRVSVDLIYGVSGQDLPSWEAELEQIVALKPDHISAYQLTYESGTLITGWMEEGSLHRLPEELELAFFEATERRLSAAGYRCYEISNFSLYGQQCAHNLNYWRNGPYVGIGPSAVSKIGHTRFGSPRQLAAWRSAVAAGRFPACWEETPGAGVRLGETWWLGLRTREGVDPRRARRTAGFELAEDPAERLAEDLVSLGWLERQAERFRLTQRGWPLADAIARQLIEVCQAEEPALPAQ